MSTNNLGGFTGENVIVTGAASGIGKATAELLASRGARVICLDQNLEGVNEVANQIGGRAMPVNMGDQNSVRNVIKEIEKEFGQIHALANSAGISGKTGTNTEEIAWEEFQKAITINLFGAIWMTQAILPGMKAARYGRIVHLSSIAGKEGNPGMSPYNTSKAGLIGYVKGVAKEIATLGITINTVAPAVIRTPINETVAPEIQAYMVSKIPAGRLGEPSEVAETIAFAASKACSFTTGFTFDVSGGRATY